MGRNPSPPLLPADLRELVVRNPEVPVLVSYVDRCAVCACSSLRDEGGRRPVPGLSSCAAGCPCHDGVPAATARSARASAAALSNDALRFRLFRRARRLDAAAFHSAR